MHRRTKIIATIGPASEDDVTLRGLIRAGMNVARLSLAHATLDEAMVRYRRIREIAAAEKALVGVLVDLPGPKIRAASFPVAGAMLETNQTLRIVPGEERSTKDLIQIGYDGLLDDIHVGDVIPFNDGNVTLEITDVTGDHAEALITHGGVLDGRPGVRIPTDRLSISVPTPQDLRMFDAFVEEGVDMVAVSLVRSGSDIRRLGAEPPPRGPLVIAKIETRAAVENLQGIITASSGIMVARGDLGTECPIEELPHLQKSIIRDCIAGGLPVITATQMLESMVHAVNPTRAEVSDVANAVFDGTSAVMLSAETAIGEHPVNVVKTMAGIAARADQEFDHAGWVEDLALLRLEAPDNDAASSITDAMTLSASRAAEELGIDRLLCISGSGFTVRSMARFRPKATILGYSHDERTVHQLAMSWGVEPRQIDVQGSYEERVGAAVKAARDSGDVEPGELIGVLAGIEQRSTSTDVFRLVRVP